LRWKLPKAEQKSNNLGNRFHPLVSLAPVLSCGVSKDKRCRYGFWGCAEQTSKDVDKNIANQRYLEQAEKRKAYI
jgi:hypothetical protein